MYLLFRSPAKKPYVIYIFLDSLTLCVYVYVSVCLCVCLSLGPLYVSSSQYRLLGVDVREDSQVEEALGAAGVDWTAPTLILSEVVLTYMETQW